ncbi:unnamed protein product [Phytophthora fragariaefolia]|uniref:Unnamed protein product n=1 Tax=Phytophthora fragariaefolia TaxID=1490495 RepID=A0A9W6X5V1_9STRA|nr:unnamed protein product [Phytophthora fragariaefolia]
MKAARPAMLHGVGLIRSPSAVFSMVTETTQELKIFSQQRLEPCEKTGAPASASWARTRENPTERLPLHESLAPCRRRLDPSCDDRIAAVDLALDAGLGSDACFADRAGTTALALLTEFDLGVLVAERTGYLSGGGALGETGALAAAETGAEVVTCGGGTATVGEARGGEPDPATQSAYDFCFKGSTSVDSSPEESDDSTSLFDKLGGVAAEPPPVELPPSESESPGLHAGYLPGGRARITTDLVAPLRDASVVAASVCLVVDELSTPDESAPSKS